MPHGKNRRMQQQSQKEKHLREGLARRAATEDNQAYISVNTVLLFSVNNVVLFSVNNVVLFSVNNVVLLSRDCNPPSSQGRHSLQD